MKNLLLVLLLVAAALPLSAAVETWNNVALVDSMCESKVKSDPARHTTRCAITCAKSGYGVFTAAGSFLKLDEAGNAKALAALKATKKEDHLTATITGERQGDTIKVKTLSLD